MTSFIIIALLITLAALTLLIVPLLRTRNTVSYERHAQNIHYARERLQELEGQLKNASISATDYEALKLEIETTLAQDIDLASQSKQIEARPRRSNKFTISLLSIGLPIAATAVYLITGTPDSLNPQRAHTAPSAEQVNQLVSGIESKLAENPDDLEGWSLLSRTYLSLGRFSDARSGYLRVIELGGESASNYAALADATALVAKGEVTAEVSSYLEKALQLNPNNQQALWLAGLGAAQKGNNAQARAHWERLADLLSELPEQQQELRQIMAQSLGDEKTQNDVLNDVAITVNVSLSADKAKLTKPEDLVFIFAKAKVGPPAPLAVKRVTVADLPTTVVLSDADAMMSQLTISKFEDLIITARVSKSGQPVAQSGDIQSAQMETKNSSKERLEVVISEIVK